jgi:hypothetical protein
VTPQLTWPLRSVPLFFHSIGYAVKERGTSPLTRIRSCVFVHTPGHTLALARTSFERSISTQCTDHVLESQRLHFIITYLPIAYQCLLATDFHFPPITSVLARTLAVSKKAVHSQPERERTLALTSSNIRDTAVWLGTSRTAGHRFLSITHKQSPLSLFLGDASSPKSSRVCSDTTSSSSNASALIEALRISGQGLVATFRWLCSLLQKKTPPRQSFHTELLLIQNLPNWLRKGLITRRRCILSPLPRFLSELVHHLPKRLLRAPSTLTSCLSFLDSSSLHNTILVVPKRIFHP